MFSASTGQSLSFHNNLNNQGIANINQVSQEQTLNTIVKLQEELLESERKRIVLLEDLLKSNNIDF